MCNGWTARWHAGAAGCLDRTGAGFAGGDWPGGVAPAFDGLAWIPPGAPRKPGSQRPLALRGPAGDGPVDRGLCGLRALLEMGVAADRRCWIRASRSSTLLDTGWSIARRAWRPWVLPRPTPGIDGPGHGPASMDPVARARVQRSGARTRARVVVAVWRTGATPGRVLVPRFRTASPRRAFWSGTGGVCRLASRFGPAKLSGQGRARLAAPGP